MFDCLFVLRDIGETRALAPVIERLHNNGRAVQTLALGQAARASLETETPYISFVVPEAIGGVKTSLGTTATAFGGSQAMRAAFVDPEDASHVAAALPAKIIVTGVAAYAQRELLSAASNMASPPATRIGLYQSLAVNKNCALLGQEDAAIHPSAAPPFATLLDQVWVPIRSLIAPLATLTRIDTQAFEAVGQPDVESFLRALPELERQRDNVRQRLHLAARESLVFFASGRDEPGQAIFRSAFKAFLRGVRQAVTAGADLQVVVGIHPACNGALERQLIASAHMEPFVATVRTVAKPVYSSQFSTNELMVASDKVLTWNSTAASQMALSPSALGKVMFINTQGPAEQFAVVEAGLATLATTDAEVSRFLRRPASPKELKSAPPTASLPMHGAQRMAERIEAAIDAATQRAKRYTP